MAGRRRGAPDIPGAGHGPGRAAERAALAGGRLEHGRDAGRRLPAARPGCRGRRERVSGTGRWPAVRVLIVDDDALVRAGLVDDPRRRPRTSRVVGEAADGAEVPAAVDALRPDVVLMDIRMPRVDGLAATEALRARGRTRRRSSC